MIFCKLCTECIKNAISPHFSPGSWRKHAVTCEAFHKLVGVLGRESNVIGGASFEGVKPGRSPTTEGRRRVLSRHTIPSTFRRCSRTTSPSALLTDLLRSKQVKPFSSFYLLSIRRIEEDLSYSELIANTTDNDYSACSSVIAAESW